MEITKDINRKIKYDKEINEIEKLCTKAKEITKKEYDKEPCLHDIVVKFYGSLWAYNCSKPDYVCLGCNKVLKDNIDLEGKNIIDLTDKFWYDVASIDGLTNNYLIILYLQELAFEAEIKIPGFTDEDFYEMIRCNTSYVNVPKDYHPKRNNVDTD